MASDGFDTRIRGAAESEWLSLLCCSGRLKAVAAPLLVVSPHPDDETFGAGGLLFEHPRSAVLLVTDGEAAAPLATLRQRRREEMHAALRMLSSARMQRLGIPDGRVAQYENRLERALEGRIQRFATLVAPFEADGHTDHDSVGRVCGAVARRHRKPLLRYLIWKWHHGHAREFHQQQFVRVFMSASALRAKRRAIACYRSQLSGGHDAVVPPHVLQYFLRPYEAFLR